MLLAGKPQKHEYYQPEHPKKPTRSIQIRVAGIPFGSSSLNQNQHNCHPFLPSPKHSLRPHTRTCPTLRCQIPLTQNQGLLSGSNTGKPRRHSRLALQLDSAVERSGVQTNMPRTTSPISWDTNGAGGVGHKKQ